MSYLRSILELIQNHLRTIDTYCFWDWVSFFSIQPIIKPSSYQSHSFTWLSLPASLIDLATIPCPSAATQSMPRKSMRAYFIYFTTLQHYYFATLRPPPQLMLAGPRLTITLPFINTTLRHYYFTTQARINQHGYYYFTTMRLYYFLTLLNCGYFTTLLLYYINTLRLVELTTYCFYYNNT